MKTVTAIAVSKLRQSGRHRCGNNLYLQIGGDGARSWIVRYQFKGRARHMGVGPTDLVTLAQAREKALEARRLLLNGIDPLAARKKVRQEASLAAAMTVTFRECAENYISAHEPSWRNVVHRQQWPASLATYVYPTIGDLPVAAIDVPLILKVLGPIWTVKPETASRISWTHREHSRFCQSARAPCRGKPGAPSRQSRPPPAGDQEDQARGPSRGVALCRHTGLYGASTRA